MSDFETGEAIDARARVVARARAELGDQDPNRYYELVAPAYVGHVHDKAWCGVFALWCLVSEGLCSWEWEDGRGFVFRLPMTDDPRPGDVAVFERNPVTGKVVWHHAIVERVDRESVVPAGSVETIAGNALPYPREGVAEERAPIDENVRFYSIAKLMQEAPTLP
jgi:hypothetical protein